MHNEMHIQGHPGNASFIMVYEDVWQALLGDPHALAVYMALIRRTHPGNRSWYSKKKLMAREAGVGLTAFEERVGKLKELGLVIVTPQYRNPDTGDISTSRDGGFIEQIQNVYTVRDRMPQPNTPTRETGDPHPRDGRPSPAGRVPPTRETGANIYPLHTSQTQIPNISSSADEPEQPDGFKDFWDNYPRKIGKGKAEEKYKEQLQATTPNVLVNAVKNFAAECRIQQTEKRYIPYPSTWLNQGRWKDYDIAPPKQSTSSQEVPEYDMNQIAALMENNNA